MDIEINRFKQMDFVDQTAYLRSIADIGMQPLSTMIGKSRTYVVNFEKRLAKIPPKHIAEKIADVLNVTGEARRIYIETNVRERNPEAFDFYQNQIANLTPNIPDDLPDHLRAQTKEVQKVPVISWEDAKKYPNIDMSACTIESIWFFRKEKNMFALPTETHSIGELHIKEEKHNYFLVTPDLTPKDGNHVIIDNDMIPDRAVLCKYAVCDDLVILSGDKTEPFSDRHRLIGVVYCQLAIKPMI